MVLVSVLLLVPSVKADAKFVFDIQAFFQEIENFFSEIDEAVNQTALFGSQSITAAKMMKNAEEVREALSKVSEYVGKAEDLYEIEQMAEQTITLLTYGQEVIMDDNYLDVNRKLSYMNMLMAAAKSNIERTRVIIQNFQPGAKAGNMNDADRKKIFEDESEDCREDNVKMITIIENAKTESRVTQRNRYLNHAAMQAMTFDF